MYASTHLSFISAATARQAGLHIFHPHGALCLHGTFKSYATQHQRFFFFLGVELQALSLGFSTSEIVFTEKQGQVFHLI